MYWYPEFTTATSLHVQIYILPQSSCRCWSQLRIGKVPNSVVGAIAVVMDENGFLMRSEWCFWWGVPQSWMTRIDPYPYMATHTHNNHETWFAYSQQAPMLTTWIDTILDSFIFALTRGSTVDEASRQVVLTELDVRQYSAETTNGWIHQKVIHVALVAQGSSSWLTNSHIVKTKSLARWRLLHWTHCSLLSDRSRLSLGPLNLVALQEALSMDDCPALLNLLSRLLVALAGKRRKLINL